MSADTGAVLLILLFRFVGVAGSELGGRGEHAGSVPDRAVFKWVVLDVYLYGLRLEGSPLVAL